MAEVALSLAVLIGAGSAGEELRRASQRRSRLSSRSCAHHGGPPSERQLRLAEGGRVFPQARCFQQFAPLPGVVDVAAANTIPMALDRTEHSRFATRFGIAGRTFEPGHFPVALNRWVSEDYLRTMGIPLRSGRYLAASDSNKPVVMINQAIADRFFAGQDPVGKQILLSVMTPKPSAVEIVGVVGDTRDWALDIEPEPTLYGVAISPSMTMVVRTVGDPSSLASAVRQAAMSTNPELVVGEIRSMDQRSRRFRCAKAISLCCSWVVSRCSRSRSRRSESPAWSPIRSPRERENWVCGWRWARSTGKWSGLLLKESLGSDRAGASGGMCSSPSL